MPFSSLFTKFSRQKSTSGVSIDLTKPAKSNLKRPGSIYGPLNTHDGEIRLLLLYPPSRPELWLQETPKCELFVTKIALDKPGLVIKRTDESTWTIQSAGESASHGVTDDEDPIGKYEALSYCWGDQNDRLELHVDGVSVSVTRSFYTAIQYLRRHGTNLLWADALCIDQEDIEERNSQVGIMRFIYEQAGSVRVWIGEAEGSTEDVFKLLRSMHVKSGSVSLRPLFSQPRMIQATAQHYRRPWFQRVWVLQEVIAKSPTVHCGQHTLPLKKFDDFFENLVDVSLLYYRFGDDLFTDLTEAIGPRKGQMLLEGIYFMHIMLKEELRQEHPVDETDLVVHIFQSIRGFKATDPRDFIYGVLGLLPRPIREAIVVDYAGSIAKVYCDATFAALKEMKSLALMLQAFPNAEGRMSELPSWVPDFHQPLVDARKHEFFESGPAKFGSCHIAPLAIRRADSENGIELKALIVDRIRWLGPPFQVPRKTATESRAPLFSQTRSTLGNLTENVALKMMNEWMQLSSDLPSVGCLSLRERQELVVRCMFRDLVAEDGFVAMASKRPSTRRMTNGDVASALDNVLEPDLTKMSHVLALERRLASTVLGARLCQLENGSLGQVSMYAAAGDVIAVIAGAAFPCVLRRKDIDQDTFTFIGACYVHGIMDAEVVSAEAARKGIEEEAIRERRDDIFGDILLL